MLRCFSIKHYTVVIVRCKVDKSVVFLAGAAPDLIISLQWVRDYNGKKYCVTPTQYGEIHTT